MSTLPSWETGLVPGFRGRVARFFRFTIEVLILVMIVFAPWAYGCVHEGFEFLLDFGVFVLVLLWAASIIVEGRLRWHKCPVSLSLAGLFLLGVWQTTPLNQAILEHVSPATAQLYATLLPTVDEQVVADEAAPRRIGVGSTISVYPYLTRRAMQRILAVVLVFLVVRHNLESLRAFQRFAAVVLVNGTCLAMFGLLQFLSSPRNLLYWSVPSMSMQVFGPFVYRNHFACYMNLCIGMGLGLLWSRRHSAAFSSFDAIPGRWETTSNSPRRWFRAAISTLIEPVAAFFRLLHDPASLWICVALALMASSIVFTLSRGGFVAFVGGFIICILVQVAGSTRFVRFGTALVGIGMMAGILGWFGLGRFEARYATIWSGNALSESRLPLWRAAANIIGDFPVWGAGLGTCQYIDPLYRRTAEVADLTVDHLHNDHLEMLVEGGVIGLGLSWGVIGFAFYLGLRAFRSQSAAGGLALGAIFALTALVVHAFGDFLVSVPAISLLATVLCAHLCNAGDRAKSSASNIDVIAPRKVRGVVSVLVSLVLTALGFLVMNEGRRVHIAETLRQATFELNSNKDRKASVADLNRRKEFLEAAVKMTPEDADLRRELADTDADLFRQQLDLLRAPTAVVEKATVLLLSMPSVPINWISPVSVLPYLSGSDFHRRGVASAEERALQKHYLRPAIMNYVQARNAAPIMPGPQLGLALHAEELALGDPAHVYLDRVQRLAPADPTFWYYCGNQELRMGQPDRAWKSWRRSLVLSDRYLLAIGERGVKFLGVDGLIERIMPDRPMTLAEGAAMLYPRSEQAALRRPFLIKALSLLDDQPVQLTMNELRTKASIYQALGRFDDAVRIYRDLLTRDPLEISCRFELADALFQGGKPEESQLELATILSQEPRHAKAFDLWTRILKDLLGRN